MFLIIGFYSRDKTLYEHYKYCSRCRRETLFNTVQRKNYLSLFFIPIPLGGGKTQDVCMVCGTRYDGAENDQFHVS